MTHGDISVRKATDGDVGDIVNLNMAMATEHGNNVLSSGRLTAGVAAVTGSTDRGFYVVAEGLAKVIAVLHVIPEWNPWRNRFFWWIENVYVVPGWRRKGVYRTMHAFVHDAAEADPDVCGLRLFATDDNPQARRTYESVGMASEACHLFETDFVFGVRGMGYGRG